MTYTVTLIPGDGTGPELAAALETVIAATGVAIGIAMAIDITSAIKTIISFLIFSPSYKESP